MPEKYPAYSYVHQVELNPLQEDIVHIVASEQDRLYLLREGRFTRSQDVEKALLPALRAIGFLHSVTNQVVEDLFDVHSDFEIDFFHPRQGVAMEIEKGKHFNVWRDVCKFAESTLVEHAVLIVPCEKASKQGDLDRTYLNTLDALANVTRLYQGLKSLLVIGY